MTLETLITLEEHVLGWTSSSAEHRDVMYPELAVRMANLHANALKRISRASGAEPAPVDKACILLGTHSLNLYLAALGLIARGQFDVVSYLMRGVIDCESLGYGAGGQPELADRYFEGKLTAADCRRLIVENIRSEDPELADGLNSRLLDDYAAANKLSHASGIHTDKLLEVGESSLTPVIAGARDAAQAKASTQAIYEYEQWQLTWFRAFRRNDVLGTDWIGEYNAVNPKFAAYMK